MDIYVLDAETYFDSDYTLSKMTTEEYVRDERFEVHGWGVRDHPHGRAIAPGGAFWLEEPQFVEWAKGIDWSQTAILCHHTHFDGLILSHRYGIVPRLYLDTLSMARAMLGTHVGKSLEALAKEFNLGAKSVPYDLFKGKHWDELPGDTKHLVAHGCLDDIRLTWDLFGKLAVAFPEEEYALIDATIRMFCVPRLVGNAELLGRIWQQEQERKTAMLEAVGLSVGDIRKDWVFARLLRESGVEPPQKRMKDGKCKACNGTGVVEAVTDQPCTECDGSGAEVRYKYAFAKTDDFMRELQDDGDEDIRLLAEAKLAAHSTGTQTRTYRLGWMASRGAMCVYLNYCGTHTKRWSGGDKVNWQNFRRGGPIGGAIEAPPGHKIVTVDASQIECRLLNMVAGQRDVIERFRNREDPYVNVASYFYGYPVNKTDHPQERQVGKVLELQAGYGSGGATIWRTLKRAGIILPEEKGEQAKNAYRETHPDVVHLWKAGGDVLKKLHSGQECQWGPVYIWNKRMWLPNGLPLIYETLKWEDDPDDGGDAGWRVRVNKNGWSKMYGAKLVENLIQALARVHVSQAWVRLKRAGLDMVAMEHDSLRACVPQRDAQPALKLMHAEMCRSPEWLPDVPLDSEGYISHTFAKEIT